MSTYSFLSIKASIIGPGLAAIMGAGEGGVAEEGINIEMIEEKDKMDVGADGDVMHTLRASNAAKFTLRLLKTSPLNAVLSAAYNFQRSDPSNWGQNTLVASDLSRGDVIDMDTVAFARQAPITYSKDANMNEWLFLGNVNMLLGTGVPDVNT